MIDQHESYLRLGRTARLRGTGEPVQLVELRVVRNGEEIWLPIGQATFQEIETCILELRRRRAALDDEIKRLSAPLRFILEGNPEEAEEYDYESDTG